MTPPPQRYLEPIDGKGGVVENKRGRTTVRPTSAADIRIRFRVQAFSTFSDRIHAAHTVIRFAPPA